jgi:GTP cyclohydrolase IA
MEENKISSHILLEEDDDDLQFATGCTGESFDVIEENVRNIITSLGEDTGREGLLKTPRRVARAYKFLTKGYDEDVVKVLNGAIFNESYNEMVIVKDIDFYSLCEHHMLPFYGKCHVAYIPDGKIVGLSKLPRIVEIFARRLQVQERMTTEIGETINKMLHPKGVAVVSEARHLCMMMRGVEKQNSIATSSCMIGVFKKNENTRQEFLKLISSQ